MSWTRRWGIIGSIALAQIGIIVGYQALVSPGPAPVCAEEMVTPAIPVQTAPPPQAGGVLLPMPGSALSPGGMGLPVIPPAGGKCAPTSSEQPVTVQVPDLGVLPAIGSGPPQPGMVTGRPDPNLLPVAATNPPMDAMSPQAPVPPGGLPPCGPTTPPVFHGDGLPKIDMPDGLLHDLRSAPPPIQATKIEPEPVGPCPWNLNMEIIDGRTHLVAKNGPDVQFKVICEKLDLQTPRGRINATGKVTITTENVEGTCERLTISWHEDAVVLEKAKMKCKLDGQDADFNAEQMTLRLSRVLPVNHVIPTPVSETESSPDLPRP
jgi:hypothetical protein